MVRAGRDGDQEYYEVLHFFRLRYADVTKASPEP